MTNRQVFINIESKTFDIEIAGQRGTGMSAFIKPKSLAELPPIWEKVYYDFMYPVVYKRDQKRGINRKYCLAAPPVWLVALAGIMWEGILQGASWDFVKMAIKAAMTKLTAAGLIAKGLQEGDQKTTSLKVGWSSYAKTGRKQYEMFLAFKRTVARLPEGHAQAIARTIDQKELGQMIRGEIAKKRRRIEVEPKNNSS